MTVEEIKQRYNMRDVIGRYGLSVNRAGFCSCPFHKGDHTASMKVYEDSFHCFGCGANGDILTFVQKMDHCDFKTAFYSLGGTYEHERGFANAKKAERERFKREAAKRQREKEAERERQRKQLNLDLIDIYRDAMASSRPFSDTWCDCYNALQIQLYHHAELNGIEF